MLSCVVGAYWTAAVSSDMCARCWFYLVSGVNVAVVTVVLLPLAVCLWAQRATQ